MWRQFNMEATTTRKSSQGSSSYHSQGLRLHISSVDQPREHREEHHRPMIRKRFGLIFTKQGYWETNSALLEDTVTTPKVPSNNKLPPAMSQALHRLNARFPLSHPTPSTAITNHSISGQSQSFREWFSVWPVACHAHTLSAYIVNPIFTSHVLTYIRSHRIEPGRRRPCTCENTTEKENGRAKSHRFLLTKERGLGTEVDRISAIGSFTGGSIQSGRWNEPAAVPVNKEVKGRYRESIPVTSTRARRITY